MMIHSGAELRRGSAFAFSDMGNGVEDGYRRRQREPLERIAVVFLDAEVRRGPLAHETVVERAVLLDHERLDRNRHRLTIALDGQVLPDLAFDHVFRKLEDA